MNKNYFVVGLDNIVCDGIFNKITKSKKKIFVKASLFADEKKYKKKDNKGCIKLLEEKLYNINYLKKKNREFLVKKKFLIKKNFFLLSHYYWKAFNRVSFLKIKNKRYIELFSETVKLIENILLNNKINYIFFPVTPHFPFQILLYKIAKFLNIKTIILQRTDIDGIYFFRNSISNVQKKFIKVRNNKKEKLIISKKIKNYFLNSNESKFLKFSKSINKKILKDNSTIFTLIFQIIRIILSELKNLYIKKKYSSRYWFKEYSIIHKIIFRILRLFEILTLKSFISKNTKLPNLKSNFVFFPLHFQPERSTVPEGGENHNQLECIKKLRKAIPNNWVVYVKEHPRQFEKLDDFQDLRKLNFRSKKFYKEIINLKNTFLVPISFDSKKLIKYSRLNVTITGSTALESLRMKKISLTFGDTWFNSLKHSLNFNNNKIKYDYLKKKIGNNHYLEDVNNFVKKNLNNFFLGSAGENFIKIDKKDLKKIINNLSEKIIYL